MAFRGKVAVIFGGGSGMGRLWAQRLADAGAEVAVCDVSESGMAETARGRSNVHPFPCDVSSYETVCSTIEAIEQRLGPIDRVIEAAAIMPCNAALAESVERVRRAMRINYEGTVHVIHAVLPRMLARDRGDLICFGSVGGYAPSPELSAYCASKAAVNTYVETLAWENRGTNVRILLICPPMTDTPLLEQAASSQRAQELFAKAFQRGIIAKPADIIDGAEASLERGEIVSYPHFIAKALAGARRLAPGMLWRLILSS